MSSATGAAKTLLTTKRFVVRKVIRPLKSGKNITEYEIQRSPSVVVFPFLENGMIPFVSQYRHIQKKQTLEAVMGYREEGESPLKAAQRELKEETGFTASQWEQFYVAEAGTSLMKATCVFYLAKEVEEGNPSPEEDEDITVLPLSLQEAGKRVMTGEICDSITALGIFVLQQLQREKKL